MEKNNNSQNQKNKCCPSQLRYDEVSRDWVVIAPGRGKRPEEYKRQRKIMPMDSKDCVFCNLTADSKPVLAFAHGLQTADGSLPADWSLAVIPNKFPAFCAPAAGTKICKQHVGPVYHSMDAAGFCEIAITRDHNLHIGTMDLPAVEEVISAYQARYLMLKKNKFVKYISIFHNHGVEAGASQPHPHSQIITSPLVDVDLANALANSKKYYKKYKKCLACVMTEWELKDGARMVCENADFVALCPFASKSAFQVVISPKKHSPNFENITDGQKKNLTQIFSAVIKKICKGLGDPAYNFYLHTAPCDNKDYGYYHWHFTIMPKTATMAGFELGTRIEISTIEPERVAEYLRGQ
jgi:UDPglucose--hexose-1-phosphate uridylyltransferase